MEAATRNVEWMTDVTRKNTMAAEETARVVAEWAVHVFFSADNSSLDLSEADVDTAIVSVGATEQNGFHVPLHIGRVGVDRPRCG
jgi:hypothetical protein